jgi:hypothetical protein
VNKVTILFRGSREDIRYLNSGQQLRIVVPISNPTANEELHIKLSEKFLQNPTSSKAVRFSPSEIFVKLDRESERLLPVKATTSGTLPDGIEVDKSIAKAKYHLELSANGKNKIISDKSKELLEQIKNKEN